MVNKSPAPRVVATEFGDSAIVFETRVWITRPSMRRIHDVKSALIISIKEAFEREGISIPFPPARPRQPRGGGLPNRDAFPAGDHRRS